MTERVKTVQLSAGRALDFDVGQQTSAGRVVWIDRELDQIGIEQVDSKKSQSRKNTLRVRRKR